MLNDVRLLPKFLGKGALTQNKINQLYFVLKPVLEFALLKRN